MSRVSDKSTIDVMAALLSRDFGDTCIAVVTSAGLLVPLEYFGFQQRNAVRTTRCKDSILVEGNPRCVLNYDYVEYRCEYHHHLHVPGLFL